MDAVAQAFRSHNWQDPRYHKDGKQCHFLHRLYQGYRNQDKAKTPQKAITGTLLAHLACATDTAEDVAIGQLAAGAFFFAMRSCKYTMTQGEWWTKLLAIRNIRSGAVMAMHLDGVPMYTIMLLGRWSSDAFLWYIRHQVQQFSSGVSARMIKHHHFYTISDYSTANTSSPEDSQTRNHPLSFATKRNCGPNAQWTANLPSFSIFA